MSARRFWIFWLVVWLAVVCLAVVAPWIAPSTSPDSNVYRQFLPPGGEHWLGTDHLGRDVLRRTIWGARNSLGAALLSTLIALAVAGGIGSAAGALGGFVDWLLMRGVDVLLAFPGLMLALALVAVLDTGLVQAAIAVGISLVPPYARLIRTSVLAVRVRPYVEVARTLGGGPIWIIRRHIIPNILGDLITYTTVMYAWSLLNLAALDFLGVSGSPSVATWGRMLGEGRAYLRVAPWMALTPGAMLTASVIAILGVSDAWRRRLPGGLPRG